jgi:hypothetical protein
MDCVDVVKWDSKEYKFLFRSGFYDHPLSGLCIYENKVHYFEWEYDSEFIEIYELTFLHKIFWLMRKKLFEICVGEHCSYDKGKPTYQMKTNRFSWFLFNFYYYGFKFNKWAKYGKI